MPKFQETLFIPRPIEEVFALAVDQEGMERWQWLFERAWWVDSRTSLRNRSQAIAYAVRTQASAEKQVLKPDRDFDQ